jgi:hypothetical protein
MSARSWLGVIGALSLGATAACNGLLGNSGEVVLSDPDGSAGAPHPVADGGSAGDGGTTSGDGGTTSGEGGGVVEDRDATSAPDTSVGFVDAGADADAIAPSACPGGEPTNACGGCGTLDGTPKTPCGACSGTWTCASDNASVSCLGDHPKNACGGCATLNPGATTPCTSGVGSCMTTGEYMCSGSNTTACNAPAGPAPISWGTTEWNGSWDRNCDGTIEYSPADSEILPYSPTYPNDGPSWPISAGDICASAAYASSCQASGFSPWINYPVAMEAASYPYPGCGEGYITFRCTLQSGKCVFTNQYCNGEAAYATDPKCTIRNDLARQCE